MKAAITADGYREALRVKPAPDARDTRSTGSGEDLLARVKESATACPCGRKHTLLTGRILSGRGTLLRLPDLLGEFGAERPAVICDTNTYRAAGQRVGALLLNAQTVILDAEGLCADERAVETLERQLGPDRDILVAVGSGTVHDITRFVAHRRGLRFISVPTAASVDGFVSSVAAMTWHGVKTTFPSTPPVAAVADTEVIAAAPVRLNASGFGDLLGKYTALFDWRLAHLVTGEYICEPVFETEMTAVTEAVAASDGLAGGREDAVARLIDALLLSGLCMQLMGNSRPASGAEHHISHLLEMHRLNPPLDALHGEKVGVATALVCDLYRRVYSCEALSGTQTRPYAGLPLDGIRRVYGDLADEVIENENTPDPLLAVPSDWRSRSGTNRQIAAAAASLPSGDDVRRMLREVGAPVTLADIGVLDELEPDLLKYAPFVRARLTGLRLLALM